MRVQTAGDVIRLLVISVQSVDEMITRWHSKRYWIHIAAAARKCVYNWLPLSWNRSVSYTHLDVYKRQAYSLALNCGPSLEIRFLSVLFYL